MVAKLYLNPQGVEPKDLLLAALKARTLSRTRPARELRYRNLAFAMQSSAGIGGSSFSQADPQLLERGCTEIQAGLHGTMIRLSSHQKQGLEVGIVT